MAAGQRRWTAAPAAAALSSTTRKGQRVARHRLPTKPDASARRTERSRPAASRASNAASPRMAGACTTSQAPAPSSTASSRPRTRRINPPSSASSPSSRLPPPDEPLEEEAAAFTEGLDITEPGRERLIEEAYRVLGLISFFTCGPDEVRAWTLHDGDNAVDAAGAIHSDLARGFIRAQVVAFDDYKKHGSSFDECRKAGCLRLEGKEYLVKDGDIIEIRFNV